MHPKGIPFHVVLLTLLALVLAAGPAVAASPATPRAPRTGILLVAFGTSVPAAQAVYARIEARVRAAHPGIPLRWAYTSRVVRQKLAAQGQALDSPEVALARMMDEGFTRVAVQSLHIIPGEEFHDLRSSAEAFTRMPGGIERITVGRPLLGAQADFERVAAALLASLPPERGPGDAVVFMGHGTPHPSHAAYPALLYHLQRRDRNVFLGTVEGDPGIREIQAEITARGLAKAFLIPFMTVAGDHAVKDMAGGEPDSWASILTGAGIACAPVLQGVGAHDAVVDIWLAHLGEALGQW